MFGMRLVIRHSAGSREALISSDIMGYALNNAGDFILDVEASAVGKGAELHQVRGDQKRVMAYASSALNKAEPTIVCQKRNYARSGILLSTSGISVALQTERNQR